jgi:LmeA-like phospholipid-binding
MTTVTAPRRGRKLRILVASLIVLVALAIAADFIFAAIGEYQVSKKMRTELKLADDPSVTIRGFPFMLQAARGDYQDIEIEANGIPIGDVLRELQVNAHLYDVKVPLSELVSGSAHSVLISQVEGQVKISAADVNRAFNATDIGQALQVSNLTISPAPPDTLYDTTPPPTYTDTSVGVRLSFSITVAGKQLKINAYGLLRLSGTKIQVQPTRLELVDGVTTLKVPDALQQPVFGALSTQLDLGKALPFTVVPTRVGVDSNAFIVSGKATNVQLGSGRSGLG